MEVLEGFVLDAAYTYIVHTNKRLRTGMQQGALDARRLQKYVCGSLHEIFKNARFYHCMNPHVQLDDAASCEKSN